MKVKTTPHASSAPNPQAEPPETSHNTPHDSFFKAVFSQPEHARGPLQQILPASVAKQLNWSTLTRLPCQHTNDELENSYSDVVFSIKAHAQGLALPRELLLLFALEHQSWVEAMMAYRLHLYTGQIWKTYVERLDAPKHYLPELVPVVLYQGKTWTAPCTLTELHTLDGQPRLLPDPMIELKYIAVPLSREHLSLTPEPVAHSGYTVMAWGALSVMTVIRGQNAMQHAAFIAQVVDQVTLIHGTKAGGLVLKYIQGVRTKQELEVVMDYMSVDLGFTPESGLGQAYARGEKRGFTRGEKRGFTKGEKRGFNRGEKKGFTRGEKRGEKKGGSNLLLKQLGLRFGELSKATRSRVQAASVKQVERWGERVLTAKTLADIFGE